MDQALNSQKTPHTSPLRASYGMSFVSILMKNDRVIKGFYCIQSGTNQMYDDKWVIRQPRGWAIVGNSKENNRAILSGEIKSIRFIFAWCVFMSQIVLNVFLQSTLVLSRLLFYRFRHWDGAGNCNFTFRENKDRPSWFSLGHGCSCLGSLYHNIQQLS